MITVTFRVDKLSTTEGTVDRRVGSYFVHDCSSVSPVSSVVSYL